MKYITQCLRTINDCNGNPRRVWVAYNAKTGTIAGTCKQTARGEPAICTDATVAVFLGYLDVTLSTYNHLVKNGEFPCYPFVKEPTK